MQSNGHSPKTQKTPSHKGRTIGIILLVLVALIAAAWVYWSGNKNAIVGKEMVKAVQKKSDGLYNVTYEDLVVEEAAGNLKLSNLTLGYNKDKVAMLRSDKKMPEVLLKATIPELLITGVNTVKALKGKEVVGKKLLINNPRIEIVYVKSGKGTKKIIPPNEIYQQLIGEMDLVKVDEVEIRNARISTRSEKDSKEQVVFSNTNIILENVAIDSASNLDTTRIFFAKQIRFSAGDIKWAAKNGNYDYRISNLAINSGAKTLRIAGIQIRPLLDEAEFVKKAPYQTDRFDMKFSDLSLTNVDFSQFMNEVIIAERMEAGKTSIKVYRDLREPRDGKNRIGTYPHQVVVDIPTPFKIGRANFKDVNIEYKETSDLSGRTGAVQFNNCNITINNITNDRKALRKNNLCTIDLNGSLSGITPITATLKLPLGDKSGKFQVTGTAGSADGQELNKITEPMGMARIRKGSVQSLDYSFKGNNTAAVGTVKLLYSDLKIDILELDNDKRSGIDKRDATSFIANLFIKDDNPKSGSEVRIANVNHARDVTRSFYNLLVKSILDGVNMTIGNKKKMKRG